MRKEEGNSRLRGRSVNCLVGKSAWLGRWSTQAQFAVGVLRHCEKIANGWRDKSMVGEVEARPASRLCPSQTRTLGLF